MSTFLTPLGRSFSPRRHPVKILLIVIVLVILLSWKFVAGSGGESSTYVTATVQRGDIQNLVTATGILQPRNYVDVGAQVSGQLNKLYVAVGSEVQAGDLLAEIDATVYKAKVDGIRAQLLNQKAQLLDKQAQLTLAQIRFDRQKNLQLDDATTTESVQTAKATLLSAQAQIQSIQAQIQQTESSLRAEEANLEYARIYAPMNGTVVTLTSRQGQTLNANQQAPTIMRIADLSSMTVQTQVSEADIGKLKIEMPVYFTTLASSERRWNSKLDRIEPTPTVTGSVVLYNALFDVPNENRVLMTQMSTQVFFVTASAKNSLIIPASAVNFVVPNAKIEKRIDDAKPSHIDKKSETKMADSETLPADKTSTEPAETPKKRKKSRDPAPALDDSVAYTGTVQVMNSKGQLSARTVTLGVSNRVDVQVIDGLKEGEIVVTGLRQTDDAKTAAKSGGSGPGMNPSRMMR